MEGSRFQVIIGGNEAGAVFSRGDAVAALELFAQVGGCEAHLLCHVSDGHLRMVGQQVVGYFHADGVDILWKGHAIGKGVELAVKTMTANIKTPHDVITQQVDLCVEPLLADNGVNGFKEVFVHWVKYLDAKLNKKNWIRKKTYARIWYMSQIRALNAVFFVNIESVLLILRVVCHSFLQTLPIFCRCDAIFSFKLFAQVGRGKSHFGGYGRDGLGESMVLPPVR